MRMQVSGRQCGKDAAALALLEREVVRLLKDCGSVEIMQHKTYISVYRMPSPQEEQWRAMLF